MSSGEEKKRVALSSVFASAALTIGKLAVGLLTGSLGILSEAAHSGLDFLAAVMTYFAVKTSGQGPNEHYPYGYAKVESISALAETVLLFVTSGWIIYEASHRLMGSQIPVKTTWYAVVLVIVSILVDFSRSRALSRVAKETQSQALEADALHFSSDIWSSIAVLLGLGLNYFGYTRADSIAALGVALIVIHAGYQLGVKTVQVLVDIAPEGLTQEILKALESIDGILLVKRLRIRKAGPTVFVDLMIEISKGISASHVEEIVAMIQQRVKEIAGDSDVLIHTIPIALSSETLIEKARIIAQHHGLYIHHIFAHASGDKFYLNFDLELDGDLGLQGAHKTADRLEEILKREISPQLETNIHLEPRMRDPLEGKELPNTLKLKVENGLTVALKSTPALSPPHDIRAFFLKQGIMVSAHVYAEATISLEAAHRMSETAEFNLKTSIPDVERLVLHIEPAP